jgi:hypothetical protein
MARSWSRRMPETTVRTRDSSKSGMVEMVGLERGWKSENTLGGCWREGHMLERLGGGRIIGVLGRYGVVWSVELESRHDSAVVQTQDGAEVKGKLAAC